MISPVTASLAAAPFMPISPVNPEIFEPGRARNEVGIRKLLEKIRKAKPPTKRRR